MSANSFAFPPPPPPPPQATNTQFASTGNPSRGRGDKRWERGSRGRGRGNSNRGSRGGGNHVRGDTLYAATHAASNGTQYGGGNYPPPNYPSVQQPQYPADLRSTYSNSPPPYAPVAGQPNHQHTYPYYAPAYPNAQPQSASYAYTSPIYNPQAPQPQPYQPHPTATPHISHRYASPPVAMGPPIRLGFGDQQDIDPRPFHLNHHGQAHGDTGHYSSAPTPPRQQSSSYGSQTGRHRPSNQQRRGRGYFNGRGRADAAGSFHDPSRKIQVAPAVPSFGNPLPTKPPAPQEEAKKIKKKKRRVNQLGLTPKTEDYISSSAEEDADEELKLAATVAGSGTSDQELKFTYKGQTSTLQSSTEIASWIEERKKRFPTAARKAEKDARLQKLKEEREEQRQASKAKKLLERQMETLGKDKQAAEQAAAEKSKLRVEKLRRKLEKEERRAAKAETKALNRSAPYEADKDHPRGVKRKRSERDPSSNSVKSRGQNPVKVEHVDSLECGTAVNISTIAEPGPMLGNSCPNDSQATSEREKEEKQEPPSLIPNPLTPTSQPALSEPEIQPEAKSEPTVISDSATTHQPLGQPAVDNHNGLDAETLIQDGDYDGAISTSSSDTAVPSDESSEDDDDDETTSSGSSSSGSDSDTESPKTVPSRRLKPQKVALRKKNNQQNKAVCRDFLRSGRCKRGKRCRWRHTLPDRGQRNVEKNVLSRPERRSLHQRLVEQEEEKEKAEKRALEQQKHETKDDTQETAA
ncbi:MAG: hypothetical protein Q9225_002495 [Loekoesia sp. 1 TL-2023]